MSTTSTYPRVNQLRDESPYRPRSGSIKRKAEDQHSYANVLTGRQTQVPTLDSSKTNEELEIEISKTSSIIDKVDTTLAGLEIDRNILMVFHDIKDALRGIVRTQEIILKERKDQQTPQSVSTTPQPAASQMVDLGNLAKKPRQTQVPSVTKQPTQPPRTVNDENPELTKFKEAVKTAENSTLVFNLDMGRVPIMNTDTIRNKATLALTTMAAKLEEGNNTSVPCEDTIASIDDVLSMVTGMELYGRKTKTYNNARDKNSGLFCTIPIKYEFPDKDTRFEAETILRDKCGVNLSTPYPAILRECIKQVIEKVKRDYPSNQVRVSVDTNNFCLKVSMRQKSEGVTNRWEFFEKNIPLPTAALDIYSRKVPEGFKMEFLPPNKEKGMKGSPEKTGQRGSSSMEEEEVGHGQEG
jgi:hypothetical protein